MTPTDLEKLQRIDAHLERLLAIASCAGNAEAGWKATRAAIQQGIWLIEMDQQGRLSLQDQGTTCQMLLEILTAFPNI